MMKPAEELILYQMKEENVFWDFIRVLEEAQIERPPKEEIRALCYDSLHKLIELTASHGFEGNLWHTYLTYLIVNHENAYSIACEIRGRVEGSINAFALHDFAIFKELFDIDLGQASEALGIPLLKAVEDYRRVAGIGKVFNTRIRDRIVQLSVKLKETSSPEEFQQAVTEFYKDFGVGVLGLHKAFRIVHKESGDRKSVV